LDSIIKLRRQMGHEATGIPRWGHRAHRTRVGNHPEALNALVRKLAAEGEKLAEEE
jgi:hypothetical protein